MSTLECVAVRKPVAGAAAEPPFGFPRVSYLFSFYSAQDRVCQIVFKEKETSIPTVVKQHWILWRQIEEESDRSSRGGDLEVIWLTLQETVDQLRAPDHNLRLSQNLTINQRITKLIEALTCYRNDMEYTERAFAVINWTTPEDTVMVRDTILMLWYRTLEVFQVSWKVVQMAEEKSKQKNISVKIRVRSTLVQKLRDETERGYESLRVRVREWIDFLNKHGMKVLKAWARFGVTGRALAEFLSEDDIHHYATECLYSLEDSCNGVLKVKLGK